MAKLKVGGNVVWLDGSPVKNGSIRIYDEDTGGDGDDLIFEKETNTQGQFQGKSAEWQDANETTLPGGFKVPVPDLLSLKFRVRVPDGRIHRGPYIHLGDYSSVPVVLPWPRPTNGIAHPAAPVQTSQRELLHIITLSEQVLEEDRRLYDTIEFAAALISQTAGLSYKQIRFIQGQNATLEQLKRTLEATASQPTIKAVDLIVSTHGLNKSLSFYPNDRHTMDEVADVLSTIPHHYRQKFRALFSTACFGASHLSEWLRVGFKVAAGARKIYADAATSYPAFIAAWTLGATFQQAVAAANASDPFRLSDQAARWKYESQGEPNLAEQIDSYRVTLGNSGLSINSAP